jgi:elongation factor G
MHTVDSKDIAFQMAGRNAVKAALEKGKTKLLQPMDKVTFLVDEKLQGEVSSIVARHDGYVSTVNPSADRPDLTEIEAILPTATIAQISDALRAESAGEGQYTSVFSHYQPVPDNAMKDVAAGALHP